MLIKVHEHEDEEMQLKKSQVKPLSEESDSRREETKEVSDIEENLSPIQVSDEEKEEIIIKENGSPNDYDKEVKESSGDDNSKEDFIKSK